MAKKNTKKLKEWQDKLSHNQAAFQAEIDKMDAREKLYAGNKDVRALVRDDKTTKTPHVRNVISEIIEAKIDSSIPQPKVTARYKKDELKAKIIEDMLRNELDRMPFEEINDMQERTVPIQGAAFYLIEWDETQRSHTQMGELELTAVHPKYIVPQDGVYTSIEDMDYIILKVPQTKGYIKNKYGVDVEDESESEPDIKGLDQTSADDLVTQYIAYFRNEDGGIGLFSWVNDTVLEDMDDYQARQQRRCESCGAIEPIGDIEAIAEPTLDGTRPESSSDKPKHVCPYCGGDKFSLKREEYEEIYIPVHRKDGSVIPGEHTEMTGTGEFDIAGNEIQTATQVPTKVPFYKPDIYPLIMQKNVSVFGKLLGDSDVDKITDQQNTINRMEAKILDKLLQSGSYMSLPDDATIRVDSNDMKVIRPGNAANAALIGVYDLEGNVVQDMNYLAQVYEEARQTIGITDSFQGRKDTTATSGRAKEFSAAQAAGRLESKRIMKNAAYARLFEAMFKFKLAYADEPRPVVARSVDGETEYEEFNRYDFLEQDENTGEWYWNDQFLFSVDTSTPLAANREGMWQETRANLQSGAFGDPANMGTLLLFWQKMEQLHYPGAGETVKYMQKQIQTQQAMDQLMQQNQQLMAQNQQMMGAMQQQQAQQPPQLNEQAAVQATLQMARENAMRDAQQMRGGNKQ